MSSVALIALCWKKGTRTEAVLIAVLLLVFFALTLFSQAPIQAGILTSPGPDFAGLQRAGIEWQNHYTETVIELANPTSDSYSEFDIIVSSTDQIYEVGEVTKLGCVSIFGPSFRTAHRLHCPQLPAEAIIQLAVVTTAMNTAAVPRGISENSFLPARPPESIGFALRYSRGKHPYQHIFQSCRTSCQAGANLQHDICGRSGRIYTV